MDENPLGEVMSTDETAGLQATGVQEEARAPARGWLPGTRRQRAITAVAAAACVLWIYIVLAKSTDPAPLPPACTAGCGHMNHTLWTDVLSAHVRPSSASGISYAGLDYEGVRNDARFRTYIRQVRGADLGSLDDRGRKALFMNAYNALAVRLLLDECGAGPCAGIKDIGSVLSPVWAEPAGQIGGTGSDRLYSLDDIEHGYLRATFRDARIHCALNCASLSCPDLASGAFEGWRLDSQLDAVAAAWMANPTKGASLGGDGVTLTLSKIFDWYEGDFAGWAGGVIGFVKAHAVAGSALASMGAPSIAYFDYNWNVNNVA